MVQASGYTNVEMNLDTGERSPRGERVVRLLQLLTGAEDAVVVNNCAAATMLVLQTTAAGREVVISRGQLVEIGGGFRLPDVFRAAGVILREVGTTNRTYLTDYQGAVGAQTGAVLRVHHSNFRMSGFVTEPSISELVSLRRPDELAVVDDLGSGWIRNLPELVLNEPSVAASVQAGADLTLFSGDKLFGGPQCGIIVGRSDWIACIRKQPLMRALRIDKLTQAALEATTEIHLSGEAATQIPCLAMLATPAEMIRERCIRVQQLLGNPPMVELVRCESQTGGGSVPGEVLPSFGLQILCEHPDAIAEALRRGRPSVQARIQHDSLLLDVRTVMDDQCNDLAKCLRRSLLDSSLLGSAS
jgi:L-seryl-tRNA(Ser) seleniumtransferase